MRLVYGGGGVEVGWGYEISCVLSREGDVGAWVLLCRPKFFYNSLLSYLCTVALLVFLKIVSVNITVCRTWVFRGF